MDVESCPRGAVRVRGRTGRDGAPAGRKRAETAGGGAGGATACGDPRREGRVAGDELPVGTCVEVESELTLTTVVRTGRSARVDDGGGASEFVNRLGIRCRVAVPIIVEGSLWGSISAGTNREQFPAVPSSVWPRSRSSPG